MSRSLKKAPYVEAKLFARVEAMNAKNEKKVLKTWSRSTTMTGGKKEIKERITLLMKKPKTALITAVALLLIATVLVVCTFSGSVDTSNDEKETEKTTEKAEPEMIALTEQELGDLAQMFDLERTYNTQYRWFNMALTSQYACPQDVDLYNLFYNGFQDEVAGPEELEKLELSQWDKYTQEGMPKHIFEQLNAKVLAESVHEDFDMVAAKMKKKKDKGE